MTALAEILATGFRSHVGRTEAIHTKDIIKRLQANGIDKQYQLDLSEAAVREAVNEIRSGECFGKLFLVSDTSAGYWLTGNPDEIERWYNGYYSRVKKMLPVVRNARNFLSKIKQSQYPLFEELE
jgi:ssDNA-specific exonuclease RecJ